MGLKRSIMEMSGNGPTIVTDDADVTKAAEAAVYGAYYNAGQVCCATERVIVVDEVHDEFVEAALKAAQDVRLGDPFDETTNMGPLNNEPDGGQDGPPYRRRSGTWRRAARRAAAGLRASRPISTTSSRCSTGFREAVGGVPGGVIRAGVADPDGAGRRRRHRMSPTEPTSASRRRCSPTTSARPSGTPIGSAPARWSSTTRPTSGRLSSLSGALPGTDTGWGRQRIDEFTDLQTVVFVLREDDVSGRPRYSIVIAMPAKPAGEHSEQDAGKDARWQTSRRGDDR